MKPTKENETDRTARAHPVIRGLGAFVGISCGVARKVRKAVMESPSGIVSLFSKATKRSAKPGKTLLTQEAIRAVVLEELARLQSGLEDGLSLAEFEERLKLMAEAIDALQQKIVELSASGAVSPEDMWDAVDSLTAAKSLTGGEKAVLVNIFKKNIALQKPDSAGADV